VPVLASPPDKARKRVKEFTKLSGEYQDSVVVRPTLRELGMRAHLAGENGFTFGLLHAGRTPWPRRSRPSSGRLEAGGSGANPPQMCGFTAMRTPPPISQTTV